MRFAQEELKILQGPINGIDGITIRYVIAVILEWRGIERQKPNGRYAKVLKVIELLCEPRKVTYSVAVAVVKSTDMQFVDDCILIP
jgi:hypothetical protein